MKGREMSVVAVIDPDAVFARLLARLLAPEDCRIVHWSSAAEALRGMRAEPPGLVVLEPSLEPAGDGWALIEAIAADDVLCDLPVVVCSADAAALRARAEMLRAHGCAIVRKPFEPLALCALVRARLHREDHVRASARRKTQPAAEVPDGAILPRSDHLVE